MLNKKSLIFIFILFSLSYCVSAVCDWNGTTENNTYCTFRGNVSYTTTTDGELEWFYLDLPVGYNGTYEYPLIIYYHGWSMDRTIYESSYYADFRNLTRDQGFIVVAPDYKNKSWMNNTARDVVYETFVLLNDSALNINNSRVYQMGESQGGMAIYPFAREYPWLIRAQADLQGLTNLSEFYNDGESATYRTSMEERLGGTPSASPENYDYNSAVYNSSDFHAIPTWAVYGQLDVTVLPKFGYYLISAFEKLGNYLDFRFDQQTHGYQSITNYEQLILDFFNVTNYGPSMGNVTLTGDSAHNLTWTWISDDVENDAFINTTTTWYRNGLKIMKANFPFELGSTQNFTLDYAGTKNITGETYLNATWNATGGYNGGGAYVFNGKDDQLAFKTATAIYGSTDITFCAWIYPLSLGWNTTASRIYSDGKLQFGLNPGNITFLSCDGTATSHKAENSSVQLEAWNHVCFSREYPTNMSKLYVNGQLSNGTGSCGPMQVANMNLTIGNGLVSGNRRPFNGTIDEVMIWNVTLADEQILALYKNMTTTIVTEQVNVGEVWKTCVVGTDAYGLGLEKCSNNLTIVTYVPPTAPVVSSVVLTASNLTNTTDENLTVTFSTSDANNDILTNITRWLVNGDYFQSLIYSFEGGSNSTWAKDYSGRGYNVSVLGATYVSTAGYDGFGAYTFDGINDKLSLGTNSTAVYGRANLTFCAWIKPMAYGESGAGRIIDDGAIRFVTITNTRLALTCDTSSTNFYSNTSSVPLGSWSHVCFTRNATGGANIYVNGNDQNGTKPCGTPVGSKETITIGNDNATTRTFNGTIDKVLIWNRTLSSEQIRLQYQNITNTILASETKINETWSSCITANDGTFDSEEACSNDLTIVDTSAPVTPPSSSSSSTSSGGAGGGGEPLIIVTCPSGYQVINNNCIKINETTVKDYTDILLNENKTIVGQMIDEIKSSIGDIKDQPYGRYYILAGILGAIILIISMYYIFKDDE